MKKKSLKKKDHAPKRGAKQWCHEKDPERTMQKKEAQKEAMKRQKEETKKGTTRKQKKEPRGNKKGTKRTKKNGARNKEARKKDLGGPAGDEDDPLEPTTRFRCGEPSRRSFSWDVTF